MGTVRTRVRDTDVTTRAHLRDAAIEVFAANGFDASVRQIAGHAGVSAALITHHFGSKVALRAECDERVIARYSELKREGMAVPPAQAIAMLGRIDEFAPLFLYMLRSVRDGGDAGRAFLESLIEDARSWVDDGVRQGLIRPSRDPEARLRYIMTSSLGGTIVRMAMNPTIDIHDMPATVRTLVDESALPQLELFTEGLLVDRRMLDEYLLYVSDPPGQGDPSPTPRSE
jgi:AcrR family transcriptional regulator